MATDIDKYLSFVLTLFLVFGLSFETPVVEMVLVRLGMVSIEKLREFRPYFIVVAFVIAAIVTPPDVISQFMLAVPMILLYEFGIFMSRYITPREARQETPAE
jgi:sec-independent protein translocase protein TatC